MNPIQHEQVKRLIEEAMMLPASERAHWLRKHELDDDVRKEVERLLAAVSSAMETAAAVARADSGILGQARTRGGDFKRLDRIGPYLIQHELGRGGMGSVLSAIRDDDNLKKRVAIKVVKLGMDSEELVKRFQLERQLLASLNHPNIAKVLDAGITDAASGDPGRPYFVMEYVEGMPLDEFCDVNELNTDERLRLFQKVCSAVHAAHQALIVHRDLKPGNILVTPDGEPKLLDFGIAKLLNADLMGVPLATLPEQRLMTPEYASPEQVRGQPITTQSDIYSLGVLLYQLLTGRLPYNLVSRAQAEIERVVCEVEPESPSTAVTRPAEVTTKTGDTVTRTPEQLAKVRESVPTRLKRRLSGDLDKIVLMAMRKAPNRRYGSAEDFAADIGNHLADLPVKARPETWVYSASRFARRHSVGVAAAGIVVVALVVGGGVATWAWKREMAARQNAEIQKLAAEAATEKAEAAQKLADAQRKRAEAANNRSSKLVKSLLSDALPPLVKLPGSVETAKKVATAGKQYVDELEKEETNDQSLREQVFETNMWMGKIAGGASGPGGGLVKQAIEHYQKALAVARADKTLMEQPRFVTVCHDLALAQIRSGQGKLADEVLFEGENVARALIPISKDQKLVDAKRVLLAVLAVQGDRFGTQGRMDEARAKISESLAIRELLSKESKISTDSSVREKALYDLGVGYSKLAKLEVQADNLLDAKKSFEKTLGLRREAIKIKSDEQRRRAYMLTMTDLANVLLELKELAGAEELSREANKFATELAADNSDSFRSRQEKVNAQMLEARILLAKGEQPRADALLANAIPEAIKLLEQSPQDVTAMQTIAELHVLRGRGLATVSKAAEAATELEKGAQAWQGLLLVDPSQTEVVRGFVDVNRSLIDLLSATEPARVEAARAAALKTLQDAQAMLSEPSEMIAQGISQLKK